MLYVIIEYTLFRAHSKIPSASHGTYPASSTIVRRLAVYDRN
jgi:hypothetical protein